MPHIAIKREFGGEKRGAELGNEFLGRIGRLPKPPLLGPIKARLVPRPMRQFVERHVVEVVRTLEPSECRHRD